MTNFLIRCQKKSQSRNMARFGDKPDLHFCVKPQLYLYLAADLAIHLDSFSALEFHASGPPTLVPNL